MSTPFSDYQTESGVAAALAQETRREAPVALHTGRVDLDGARGDLLVFRLGEGSQERLEQLDLEDYAPTPYRKRGRVIVADQASFASYVARHKSEAQTTLWASFESSRVVAVLDDHAQLDDTAGWGGHRAELVLQPTQDWKHWTAMDGRWLSQADFAEHLEDGADAIVSPSSASMLEIAQSFQAKNNVAFRSSHHLASGEVQLVYEEQIQAKAGQKGNLTIPISFEVGLAPYEGGDAYRMLARFRYRIADGTLRLGYKLIRPDQIQRAAFDDQTKAITEQLSLPVLKGTPRS